MVWVGSSVGGVEYKTPVYIMPDMVELCNMTDQSEYVHCFGTTQTTELHMCQITEEALDGQSRDGPLVDWSLQQGKDLHPS